VKSKLSWHSDSRVTVNQRISGVLSLHASFDSYMKWLKVDSGISFRWVNTNSFRMMSSHLVWYDHLRRTIIEDYPYITAGKLNFAVSHEVCCAFYFECFIGCTTKKKHMILVCREPLLKRMTTHFSHEPYLLWNVIAQK
jgi:hypothetical protein